MKKLLSMIGAMTLIWTATTSVIACDKGEAPTPKPEPTKRINLSLIISDFNKIFEVKNVIINNLTSFIDELIKAIKQRQSIFNHLEPSDINVYKTGSQELTKNDIYNRDSWIITIQAKNTSVNFVGLQTLPIKIILK